MVRGGAGTAVARMVELRAVEAAFPFYGTLELAEGADRTPTICCANRGALVRPELLAQLGTQVGDASAHRGQPFTIRGVIAQEPGRRIGAFSFGPRVIVDLAISARPVSSASAAARATRSCFKVREDGVEPSDAPPARASSATASPRLGRIASLEDDIGEDLGRAENYLSLVGFVIVVLGGIGVWSVTRVFVQQKIRSVAILSASARRPRRSSRPTSCRSLLLGLAGSVARRRARRGRACG